MCSAFSSFLLYIANDKNGAAEVTYWTMGSLGGAKWENVQVILPVILIGTLIFWSQFRNLNLMLLGDEVSITLGTDLHKARMIYMILSSLMVGFAVYCAGMIGFVGLIIPHVIRMVFGTDHRRMIPFSGLLGAIFLIWADVICRIILIRRGQGMKVEAEQVEVSYGARKILKEVSINAGEREFVGIIGPNGSGKSTLLKCMYRILKPEKGCIYLDGREMQSMSVRESARKMAVVAQHNYYNFEFSVSEVVLMGRAPHKKSLERDNARDYEIVEEALKTVGMWEFRQRSFSTLSGGEQQRVILARALAQQTPCLILDEPTNHLDITHQLQLMKLVKQLDATIISAIHDLNIAAAFCDKLYALKDGEIVGYGKPEEVLTREFIQEVYEVEAEIARDRKGKIHILFL